MNAWLIVGGIVLLAYFAFCWFVAEVMVFLFGDEVDDDDGWR